MGQGLIVQSLGLAASQTCHIGVCESRPGAGHAALTTLNRFAVNNWEQINLKIHSGVTQKTAVCCSATQVQPSTVGWPNCRFACTLQALCRVLSHAFVWRYPRNAKVNREARLLTAYCNGSGLTLFLYNLPALLIYNLEN